MKKLLTLLFLFVIISFRSEANGGCAFTYQVDTSNTLTVYITYIGWPGLQSYNYDFGDSFGTSTQQNPSYTYATAGNYNITLNTLDTNGITCTFTLNAVVGSSTFCSFTYSGNAVVGAPMTFTNTTSGTVTSYHWDFGDGVSSTLQSPTHTFAIAGQYAVCLTTTDQLGLTCSVCQPINITHVCNANFQSSSSLLTTYFVENTLNTNPSLMSYQWDFGDGSSSTLRYPVHTFSTPNIYNVCLYITDNSTCFDTVCNQIYVDTLPPIGCRANYLFTQSQPYSVDIVNVSYGASPLTYSWNFGDGGTSTLAYPTHTYLNTGTFTICLSITDSIGCNSTYCDSVTIDSLGNLSSHFVQGFSVTVLPPSDLTLSVETTNNLQVSINPNPAHDYFIMNVEDAKHEYEFILHSYTGSICKKGHLSVGKNLIDIANLNTGVYFLEMRSASGEKAIRKIVKE